MKITPRTVLSVILLGALSLNAKVAENASPVTSDQARELIAQVPERSGGIYYAYPVTEDVMPAIPAGYQVNHISHYGRHGSRWLIKMWEYEELDTVLGNALKKGQLTPLGADVYNRVKALYDHARGNEGALSPLGEQQHRGIAERMVYRFPTLFYGDKAHVDAHSSTEPRCIMSMAAFTEQLRSLSPFLSVQRHASPGDMNYIHYTSPRFKSKFNKADAPWWEELEAWRDSVVDPTKLVSELFVDPAVVENPVRLMWELHDLAVDTQDVNPGVELLDIFTPSELYNLWTCLNYKMYYLHGMNPATNFEGPRCAVNLLNNFIDDIDSAIAGDNPNTVSLRFGHDTSMLRLMALMGIENASAMLTDPSEYMTSWRDYTLTPMAANLQLVLLTGDGEPLVLLRHNERPTSLSSLEKVHGDYYRWSDVKEMWKNAIKSISRKH